MMPEVDGVEVRVLPELGHVDPEDPDLVAHSFLSRPHGQSVVGFVRSASSASSLALASAAVVGCVLLRLWLGSWWVGSGGFEGEADGFGAVVVGAE